MDELRNCPFCGGEAKLNVDFIRIFGERERCAWVFCKSCNARTNYYRKTKKPIGFVDAAIWAWNTRDWNDGQE